MAPPPVRAVNLQRQLAAIRRVFPEASSRVRNGELVCTVALQPTVLSRTYNIRLNYRHGTTPRVDVTEPQLELHPDVDALPHIYSDGSLCLYYYGEWDDSRLLASTVLPWASEWLLHYELWLATGTWHGGGTTHGPLTRTPSS